MLHIVNHTLFEASNERLYIRQIIDCLTVHIGSYCKPSTLIVPKPPLLGPLSYQSCVNDACKASIHACVPNIISFSKVYCDITIGKSKLRVVHL